MDHAKRTYGVEHGADISTNDGQFVSSAHQNGLRVVLVSDQEAQQWTSRSLIEIKFDRWRDAFAGVEAYRTNLV